MHSLLRRTMQPASVPLIKEKKCYRWLGVVNRQDTGEARTSWPRPLSLDASSAADIFALASD